MQPLAKLRIVGLGVILAAPSLTAIHDKATGSSSYKGKRDMAVTATIGPRQGMPRRQRPNKSNRYIVIVLLRRSLRPFSKYQVPACLLPLRDKPVQDFQHTQKVDTVTILPVVSMFTQTFCKPARHWLHSLIHWHPWH